MSLAFERAIFALYLMEQGYTITSIGMLQVCFFVGNLISEIPTGVFADRFGRLLSLRLAAVLLGLTAIAQLLLAPSHNHVLMGLVFALSGTSFAFISGAASAELFERLRNSGRGIEFASLSIFSQLVSSSALALAMFLGATAKQYFSVSVPYVASLVAHACALVPLLGQMDHPRTSHGSKRSLGQHLQCLVNPAIMKPVLAVALPIALVHGAMTPYFVYAQLVFRQVAMPDLAVGLFVGLGEVVGALTVWWIARHGLPLELRWAKLAIVVLALALALNAVERPLAAATAFILASAAICYISAVAEHMYHDAIGDDDIRASVLSAVTLLDSLFISLSYVCLGFLIDRLGAAVAIAVIGALPTLSFVWLLMMGDRVGKRGVV